MTLFTPRSALALVAVLAGLAGCFSSSQIAPQAGGTSSAAQRAAAARLRRTHAGSMSVLPPAVQRALDRKFRAGGAMHALPGLPRNGAWPNATNNFLFVSDFKANAVYQYDISKRPPVLVHTISGLDNPQGLTLDGSLNLYVANTQKQDVPVYAPPYNGNPTLLNDIGSFPVGVAVDPGGNTYVANISSFSGPGNVERFMKGSKNGVQVGDPNLAACYFIAIDSHGNIFVDGINESQVGELDESSDGAMTWQNMGVTIGFPGGVTIDAKGEVLVMDQNSNAVSTYSCNGTSCSLVSKTTLQGSGNVVSFKLASTQADLWAADAVKADAADYPYPAGGNPIESLTGFMEPIDTALVGTGAPPSPTPTPTKKPTPTPSPSPVSMYAH